MKNMNVKLWNGVMGLSNISRVYPCNVLVDVDGTTGKLMADQIMTADKSRLKKCIGILSSEDMVKVEDTVRMHLGLGGA